MTGLNEPGRFMCPLCPVRLETVGDKKRHIRDDHPKETDR